MKSWLYDLSDDCGNAHRSWLLQRGLRIVLFFVLLGVPAFSWVQYRQAQNLERLTSQNLSGIEWDAFKLELRSLHLRNALQEAVLQPDSPQALAKASTEYNLFASHVLMMRGLSHDDWRYMDGPNEADKKIFTVVLDRELRVLSTASVADPALERR